MLQSACDTFQAMQGVSTTTTKYERLYKRWEEEKSAVLWLVLSRFVDEPSDK
ncbi:hypothetical protein HUW52_09110 [Pseudomonas sp. 43A]|uniref:hypothetical protein n=1 Tax=unclassified Pseudomonas TaxID=196821 RepID=UPI001587030F|nr:MULTISPECIES: hypothetical protein [unclassified Pseudomonas]QKV63035.1 hypothetical protein HUW52_09110 [Pseudomonas sp. 43A]QMW08825.1 hypothetical protein H3303_23590 [Pseudomonas sp. 29A]